MPFHYRTLLPNPCYTEIHGEFTETHRGFFERAWQCKVVFSSSDSIFNISVYLCALRVTDFGDSEKVSGSEYALSVYD